MTTEEVGYLSRTESVALASFPHSMSFWRGGGVR
jgi:hypothetical protein